MDAELIRNWLRLPPGDWPPDHYTLLGLQAGETDTPRIEQQVYERMELARRYQLTHPEAATEAMNRLARALVCLTDPAAKAEYDAALLPAEARSSNTSADPEAAAARSIDPLAVILGLRDGAGVSRASLAMEQRRAPLAVSARLSAPAEEVPAIAADGRDIASGGRAAIYARVRRVRQLLWSWEQTGQFLQQPPLRVVNRPADVADLMRHMQVIRELQNVMSTYLATARSRGQQVLMLAQQEDVVPRLKLLTPPQREALARDWQAGYQILRGERRALRDRLRTMRRRRRCGWALRLLGAAVRDNVDLVLLGLAIIALNVAFQDRFPALWQWRSAQALAFVLLASLKLFHWFRSRRPSQLRRRSSAALPGHLPGAGQQPHGQADSSHL
jgi:hypothetical protein